MSIKDILPTDDLRTRIEKSGWVKPKIVSNPMKSKQLNLMDCLLTFKDIEEV